MLVQSLTGAGEWLIDDAGRVSASGDAELIAPTGGCDLPDTVCGTDVAG